MREPREGSEVVVVTILVRDPGHRDQPGTFVDMVRESLGRRRAATAGNDADLDAPGFGEMLVEDVTGFEVEIVEYDVVAWSRVDGPGYDVFPLAGGIEQSDLRLGGSDEPREFAPCGVSLLHHGAQAHRDPGLRVEEVLDGLHRRVGEGAMYAESR